MTENSRRDQMLRRRFDEWRLPPILLVRPESLSQRCSHLADADVDAQWLRDLAGIVDGMPLHDANSAIGLGAGLVAAAVPSKPWFLDFEPASPPASESSAEPPLVPAVQAARGLVQLVGQFDRLMAWAGAQQAAAMAALGRPGVAVPIGDVLDAVTQGGSGGPVGVDSTDALCDSDFEADAWHQVSVSGDPGWDDAAQDQARRFAAAEVGARLGWSPGMARSRMCEATDVVDNLPVAFGCGRRGVWTGRG